MRSVCPANSLAEAIAEKTGWSMLTSALKRNRITAKQGMLTWSERTSNVRGAFQLSGNAIEKRRVVLVDDVLTSGATAHEITKLLLRAGATDVQVAVVARGVGARETVLKNEVPKNDVTTSGPTESQLSNLNSVEVESK